MIFDELRANEQIPLSLIPSYFLCHPLPNRFWLLVW
jgi:hypothetical protein